MIEKAKRIYESYDIPALVRIDLSRASEHFGSSHTVVTYPPLNTLGKITQEEVVSALSGEGPINLYVHIPFCRSKCGYCSYVSEPNAPRERMDDYLSALSRELDAYGKLLKNRNITSVYIGGGTPTILSPPRLDGLIKSISNTFDVRSGALCIEANPETLLGKDGLEKLELLVKQGTQRVSIGVQSFNDRLTKIVGRGYYHSEDVKIAVSNAKKAGIKVLNVDLMQDLPSQTLEDVCADLEAIAELKPDSITWYTMRMAPNCWLFQKTAKVSKEQSLIARIMIAEQLKELGYTQISGDRFCLDDNSKDRFKEVRSSVTADLLGIGVSAYSHFLSAPWHMQIFRNVTNLDEYIRTIANGKLPAGSGREYTPEEKVIGQFVMGLKNGLQLPADHNKALFESGWTWDFSNYELFRLFGSCGYRKTIPTLMQNGLLELEDNRLQLTPKGRLFENEICRKLYSPVVDARMKDKNILAFLREFFWDLRTTPRMVKA